MTEPVRPWWRRLRLSIRGLMILVLAIGAPLGWYLNRVADQRAAVRAVTAGGGSVEYDYEYAARTNPLTPPAKPPAPDRLVKILGIDFFANVISVKVGRRATEDILPKLARLRGLRTIDARKMPVSDTGLSSIAGLTRLESLSIDATPRLTDAGLAHLAGMKKLGVLWMNGTPSIRGPGLAHLAGLQEVHFLAITSETSVGLENVTRLGKLRMLLLDLGEVDEEALTQISRMTPLEHLALGSEKGKDTGIEKLTSLRKLKILQVNGPWFTDAGLDPVAELGSLGQFFVSVQTKITPEALARLRRRRPSLDIQVTGSRESPGFRTTLLEKAALPQSAATP